MEKLSRAIMDDDEGELVQYMPPICYDCYYFPITGVLREEPINNGKILISLHYACPNCDAQTLTVFPTNFIH